MERKYSVKNFNLDENTLKLQETLFHNANGYLGVRGNLEEGVPAPYNTMRGMYLNGFYDVIPMKQSESLCNLMEEKDTMLNIADTQSIQIVFDDEVFTLFDGQVSSIERILDMDAGVTRRIICWQSPKGKKIELSFTRMVSFYQKNTFTIDCEIHSMNYSGPLRVVSKHQGLVSNYSNPKDPRMGASSLMLLQSVGNECNDGATYLITKTTKSDLTLCSAVKTEFVSSEKEFISYDEKSHVYTDTNETKIVEGESVHFIRYSVFVDSRHSSHCLEDAKRILDQVYGNVSSLYDRQKTYLSDFWHRASTDIQSGDDSAIAMAFNQYQLLQSCGTDGISGMASKGLSGEGYEGHYFWDTEIYIIPFFTYTNPGLARKLLGYRFETLALAKDNAKLLGHNKGALYPWRTISGRECSGYFPSGSAQYHINGDIAHAVVQYYLATGDKEYLAEEGAEILVETARLWMDAGNWCDGKFMINDVTGPDEYTCIVNNNFYTNACAKYNLYWAYHCLDIISQKASISLTKKLELTPAELRDFKNASDHMYLPFDENLGINPQDDSFLQKPLWDFANTPKENYPLLLHYHPLVLYRHQVCKQADTVLAYFLYDQVVSREVMVKSFEYYEKITTHDSSLSQCAFSIVAARLGMLNKAWNYFGESLHSDLINSHGNTGDGIHTANMGGSYMVVVNGFAGVSISEDGLSLNPVVPKDWEGYQFRMVYLNTLLEISVNHNQTKIELLKGNEVSFVLNGKPYHLSENHLIEVVTTKE